MKVWWVFKALNIEDFLQCEEVLDPMLFLAKKILIEYKNLVVQMFEEHVAHDFTKSNLELLCDIKVFLGLACIIPMLECV